jgi:hypothetical protein
MGESPVDDEWATLPAADRSRRPRGDDAAYRVFTVERLSALPTLQIQGADNARLTEAMYALAPPRDASGNLALPPVDDPKILDALRTVAEVRGVPMEQISADYERFRDRAERAEIAARRLGQEDRPFVEGAHGEHRVPPLSSSRYGLVAAPNGGTMQDHHNHMGSLDQLRFGSLVGEALGIDPVFGALLSPTGGLVGAGNDEIRPSSTRIVGDREAVVAHGQAHDAAGYLRNYQGIGPGYNYVPGAPRFRNDTDPIAGQLNGLNFFSNLRLYGDPFYVRRNDP